MFFTNPVQQCNFFADRPYWRSRLCCCVVFVCLSVVCLSVMYVLWLNGAY